MSKQAVSSSDPEILRLLEALGMPERCTRFTVTASMGEPVTAEATYYPSINADHTITKHYTLQEIESVQAIKDRCPG